MIKGNPRQRSRIDFYGKGTAKDGRSCQKKQKIGWTKFDFQEFCLLPKLIYIPNWLTLWFCTKFMVWSRICLILDRKIIEAHTWCKCYSFEKHTLICILDKKSSMSILHSLACIGHILVRVYWSICLRNKSLWHRRKVKSTRCKVHWIRKVCMSHFPKCNWQHKTYKM